MISSLDHNASGSKLGQILWKELKNSNEEELFEHLLSEDKVLRTIAACEIQIRSTPSSFDRTLILTNSIRFEVREIAAFVLGQMGSPTAQFHEAALAPLSKLLRDPYYEVRAAVIGSFGFLALDRQSEHSRICSEILALLDDPEPTVREALAFSLSYIHTEEAFIGLIKLSSDWNVAVRNAAFSSLENHNDQKENLKP